ncbi:MAG: 4Fe-4S binding protein [Coriobacteriales bacterium]|jgi:Fe-S-cluster-containing dehydrogenase component|nr:4Fe-4S binding protein [Coriobacteriales bacterium]
MKAMIHVDLNRCIGCWTCAMACKVGNKLADDDYRIKVETLGSGKGNDRPAGTYPALSMSWLPLYQQGCTFCAGRTGEGKNAVPFCVMDCPTEALAFGDADDPASAYNAAVKRCADAGSPAHPLDKQDLKVGITYSDRR